MHDNAWSKNLTVLSGRGGQRGEQEPVPVTTETGGHEHGDDRDEATSDLGGTPADQGGEVDEEAGEADELDDGADEADELDDQADEADGRPAG